MKGMKIVALSALASLGLVTATSVYAMGDGKASEAKVEKMMMKFDSNQDGQITKEEALAVRMTFFTEADANADGALSLDEFKAAKEKKQEKRFKEYFAKMDTDSNGSLSVEELLNAKKDRLAGVVDDPEKELKDRFAKMDTDSNATLTAEELMEGKKKGICGDKWAKKDTNLDERFANKDSDKDGSISKAEFESNTKLFDMFDANKDGIVTKDEIMSGKKQKMDTKDVE